MIKQAAQIVVGTIPSVSFVEPIIINLCNALHESSEYLLFASTNHTVVVVKLDKIFILQVALLRIVCCQTLPMLLNLVNSLLMYGTILKIKTLLKLYFNFAY